MTARQAFSYSLSAMKTSAPTKPQVFKHAARTAWRKVADEAVILDTETAAYFSLDGVGLRVWELMGEGRSVPEIVAALVAEYDASEDAIRKDVLDLIRKLRQEKIAEPA